MRESRKSYNERHKEDKREYNKKYYAAHRAQQLKDHKEYHATHREVHLGQFREYAKTHYEERFDRHSLASRVHHLKKQYNLSLEEFEAFSLKQQMKCLLCGRTARLVVDHDHATGEIRGLLCIRCNLGLAFVETPGWLERVKVYLGLD